MFKRRWLPAGVLFLAAIVLLSCATPTDTSSATPPTSSPPSSVAPIASAPGPTPTPVPELVMITDGEVAWESDLATWAAQAGLRFTVANPSGASAYLRESQPHIAAVVSVREALDGGLQQAAAEGIPVVMVDVPGIEPGPSLSNIGNARHDQAGFLAGVMTGLASQTGWVGEVTATGGPDEQAYSAGFTQGLLWGCPKCQLISQTANELTLDRFRANTVDVVFLIPGPAAVDAAQVLAEDNLALVWVGENGPAAETRVGRVMFEADHLVVPALEALMETGEGMAWSYSIEGRSILLVDINATLLSPGRQRLLDEAYEAIAAGELDIGTIPEG